MQVGSLSHNSKSYLKDNLYTPYWQQRQTCRLGSPLPVEVEGLVMITLFLSLVGHTNDFLRGRNWGLGWKMLEKAKGDISSYALVEIIP